LTNLGAHCYENKKLFSGIGELIEEFPYVMTYLTSNVWSIYSVQCCSRPTFENFDYKVNFFEGYSLEQIEIMIFLVGTDI